MMLHNLIDKATLKSRIPTPNIDEYVEAAPKIKLWQGSQYEYDTLEEKEPGVAYMITEPATISYASDLPLSAISLREAINDIMTTCAPYKPSSVRYVCEYCGSEYYSDGGFVPPCNGCGARLRRASDVE